MICYLIDGVAIFEDRMKEYELLLLTNFIVFDAFDTISGHGLNYD